VDILEVDFMRNKGTYQKMKYEEETFGFRYPNKKFPTEEEW
jgi:hypothetical protein